jgi:hypothetical protein
MGCRELAVQSTDAYGWTNMRVIGDEPAPATIRPAGGREGEAR